MADVEVGRSGQGSRYAGSVVLADANDFEGDIVVNCYSTLTGYAQAPAGGSPFGAAGNDVILRTGTLAVSRGGQTTAREPVEIDGLTIQGGGTVALDGNSSASASLSAGSLTLDPANGGSALSLKADTADLGVREFLLVRDNPPAALSGAPGDMLSPRFRSSDLYFLKYDADDGFLKVTDAEVDLDNAGDGDIALVTTVNKTVTGEKEVHALTVRSGSGRTISDGGDGKLVVLSGGIGAYQTQSGATTVNVPVQFGPDGAGVEGVLYSSGTSAFFPTLAEDVIAPEGLFKFGPGNFRIKPTGSDGSQHLGLRGRITIVEGALMTDSGQRIFSSVERFPNVTEMVLNGGAFAPEDDSLYSMPIVLGPNGGKFMVSSSAAAIVLNFDSDIQGPGSLVITGMAAVYLNGSNTYTGGTWLNRVGGTVTVASDSALGTGDVRLSGGTLALRGQNINRNASVVITGGTLAIRYFADFEVDSIIGTSAGSVSLGDSSGSGTAQLVLGVDDGSSEIFGVISNNSATRKGALKKVGAGVVLLGGANTYTGGTIVNAGTLIVNGSLAAGDPVQVNAGILAGHGAINSAVNIAAGATLMAGEADVPGTLTVASLNLDADSTTAFSIEDDVQSKLIVNGNLTLAGTIRIAEPASPVREDETYELMTYTGTLTMDSLPALEMPEGYLGKLSVDTDGQRVLLGMHRQGGFLLIIR